MTKQLTPILKPHIESGAARYAFNLIKRDDPELLTDIQKDLNAGLSPDDIESAWWSITRQEQMSRMVGLAARFIAEGSE